MKSIYDSKLSMSILRVFYSQFPTRTYKKGEIILLQDEVPTSTYAVKVGSIRMYSLGPDGGASSISFAISGEIFPIGWTFSKAKKALFYYEAHTDCILYVMDKEMLINAVDQNLTLSRVILDHQVRSYVGTNLQIKALGQSRASTKLTGMLHYLCLRFGREIAKDRVRIEIPFTQDDLASLLGITRETTVHELSHLKSDGVITSKNKYYTVDTKKLNDLIDGEYNPGIEIS